VSMWIGNSVTEAERLEQGLRPPDMSRLVYQQADMRILDALIYNTDRHAGNQLYTLGDWQLHLIDHSRAFRTSLELPEDFVERPITMTRTMRANLEALELQHLKKLFKRELGPTQVKSLLTRRDRILEKFDRDRQEYGEAFAYREERPQP